MEHKSILIADDDEGLVKALKLRCEMLGVSVETASNGAAVLQILQERTPDLLILDIGMPALDGLSVGETLTKNASYPPMPLIFFSGRSDPETVRRCESMGAHYVFKDADTWSKLQPLIARILRSQIPVERKAPEPDLPDSPDLAGSEATEEPQPEPEIVFDEGPQLRKVLVIDDDLEMLKAVKIRLEAAGLDVLTAVGGMQGFLVAQKNLPDVIVTDYAMPQGDGESLLIKLKADPLLEHIPVIVMTGRTAGGKRTKSLQNITVGHYGAAAFFTKPLEFEPFVDEVKRLAEPDEK